MSRWHDDQRAALAAARAQQGSEPRRASTAPAPEPEVYDPGDHNVGDVQAYVEENPDERDAVLEAERAGKDRVTLVEWLSDFEA